MKTVCTLFCLMLMLSQCVFALERNARALGEAPGARSRGKSDVKHAMEQRIVRGSAPAATRLSKSSTLQKAPGILPLPSQLPMADGWSYVESCPLTLANGDLLVVYESPNYGDTLYALRSTNGGTSWSPPSVVCVMLPYNFSIAGVRMAGGRIVLAWTNWMYGVEVIHSNDNGVSWSTPVQVTTSSDDEGTTLTETNDGTLWLSYSNTASSSRVFYRTSRDSGNTWSEESMFSGEGTEEYYLNVMSRDSSTLLAVYEDNTSDSYGLFSTTSLDSGATWSTPQVVVDSLDDETRPRLLRQSDGTLWVVYQVWRPSVGGGVQTDIAYVKSNDSGSTWSAPSRFTNYAGFDGWVNACMNGTRPLITFASERWCPIMRQTQLWYGNAGLNMDYNPPPALLSMNTTIPVIADSVVWVNALVDDETGVSNVTARILVNDELTATYNLKDDGASHDGLAGDGTYGLNTVGAFDRGNVVDIDIAVTDIHANTVTFRGREFDLPLIHDTGNIALQFSSTSELGDRGQSAASARWPKVGGDRYLFDGGLWVGCTIGGDTTMVRHEYSYVPGWIRTPGTPCTLGPGLSDQDGDITYHPRGADTVLGLSVHQQSYQWSDTTRDDFIVFKYTVSNRRASGTLNDVAIAQWLDPDVSFETEAYNDYVGYDSLRHMLYMYHAAGTPAGYFGLKLLGAGATPSGFRAYYGDMGSFSDGDLYAFMTTPAPAIPNIVYDYRFLLTGQPVSLAPGDSATVAFGIVLGNGLAELRAHADTMEAIVRHSIVTGVSSPGHGTQEPGTFALQQNWPNPCNPSTTIAYQVGAGSRQYGVGSREKAVQVKLAVYDLLGREVATLVDGYQAPGEHRVVFNGSNLSSGVYFYRLTAGGQALSKKLVLLK